MSLVDKALENIKEGKTVKASSEKNSIDPADVAIDEVYKAVKNDDREAFGIALKAFANIHRDT